MSNVLQRLRKLESRMTDRSGLTPHSEAWFAHWSEKMDQFLTKRDSTAVNGMPLAYIDAIIAKSREAKQER
jgi:hypothetical protein